MLKILHILLLFKKNTCYYYFIFNTTVINFINIFKNINKIYNNIIDMLKKHNQVF